MSETEQFVRNLYEGVLRREPDEVGLQSHLLSLGDDPTFSSAAGMLAAFRHSGESRQILKMLAPANVQGFATSVGSHCITAMTLQSLGLRSFAGPFDWIFFSPAMAAHCISDRFETFLDPRYHRTIPPESRQAENANFCEHLYYQAHYGVNSVFNHYDITQESAFSYYRRCVARFMDAVDREDSTLVNVTKTAAPGDFASLCDALRPYRSRLIFVDVTVHGAQAPSLSHVEGLPGRHLYHACLTSNLGPTAFEAASDELLFGSLVYGAMQTRRAAM